MHISEILKRDKISFSFEFFPPKTEKGSKNLFQVISELIPLDPSYVSVTYGAGGSTRQLTHDLITKIQSTTDLTVVSHLTCVGSTKDEIRTILDTYCESGIKNIMALRGDPPYGEEKFVKTEGGFEYAYELVEFIKKNYPEMGIGVAGFPEGHPETPNRLFEIENLKRKVDAGADYICTQLFFNNADFYDFRERCEVARIHVPIIAGIMPITSFSSMNRMSELALGMRYPARLLKSLKRAESDDYAYKVGVHWATEQVDELIDHNVEGIHFYTLNKSNATLEIYSSLGVSSSASFNK